MKHLPILHRADVLEAERRTAGKLARCRARYTATWVDTGHTIYRNARAGTLLAQLPACRPDPDPGTLSRTDGGDDFECAFFVTAAGRRIRITLDERTSHK